MVDDRNTENTVYVEKRSNTGFVFGGIVLVALVIVGVLFATGFWSANITPGALPTVSVNSEGGHLPEVNVHSKEIVVGTSKQTVTVPKIETQKTTIDVPTVGVKDNSKKSPE